MNSFSAHIIIDDEVYEKTLTTDKKKTYFIVPGISMNFFQILLLYLGFNNIGYLISLSSLDKNKVFSKN